MHKRMEGLYDAVDGVFDRLPTPVGPDTDNATSTRPTADYCLRLWLKTWPDEDPRIGLPAEKLRRARCVTTLTMYCRLLWYSAPALFPREEPDAPAPASVTPVATPLTPVTQFAADLPGIFASGPDTPKPKKRTLSRGSAAGDEELRHFDLG